MWEQRITTTSTATQCLNEKRTTTAKSTTNYLAPSDTDDNQKTRHPKSTSNIQTKPKMNLETKIGATRTQQQTPTTIAPPFATWFERRSPILLLVLDGGRLMFEGCPQLAERTVRLFRREHGVLLMSLQYIRGRKKRRLSLFMINYNQQAM